MSYVHLNRDDRVRLDTLLKTGLSFRGCAWNLGFSVTAISEEVKANGGRHAYNPYLADRKAREKRKNANQCHRKMGRDEPLTELIIFLLELGWTPEQVVGRIELELGYRLIAVSTIYNYANSDKELCKLLARGHNKYRRTKAGNERQKQREELDSRKSIDLRSEKANTRERIGDWEGDTIIGKEKTARILTHVERKTGYLLADLLHKVSAEIISQRTIQAFEQLPASKRLTVTCDRGSEFANHEITERNLKISFYFAHAYHSWERGTNENTNGLVRRYYPKKTLFANIKKEELAEKVKQINHRPRKRLGYRSPHEEFWGVKLRMIM